MIEKLPHGAIVVNTARGDLVKDDDMIAALKSGRLGYAGLDVFAGEPAINEGYYDLPNTFLFPHLGSAAIEARNEMGFEALDNIDAFFAGKEMPFKLAWVRAGQAETCRGEGRAGGRARPAVEVGEVGIAGQLDAALEQPRRAAAVEEAHRPVAEDARREELAAAENLDVAVARVDRDARERGLDCRLVALEELQEPAAVIDEHASHADLGVAQAGAKQELLQVLGGEALLLPAGVDKLEHGRVRVAASPASPIARTLARG